jgi:hypothetical protein
MAGDCCPAASMREIERKLTAGLTDAERAALIDLMERVISNAGTALEGWDPTEQPVESERRCRREVGVTSLCVLDRTSSRNATAYRWSRCSSNSSSRQLWSLTAPPQCRLLHDGDAKAAREVTGRCGGSGLSRTTV